MSCINLWEKFLASILVTLILCYKDKRWQDDMTPIFQSPSIALGGGRGGTVAISVTSGSSYFLLRFFSATTWNILDSCYSREI